MANLRKTIIDNLDYNGKTSAEPALKIAKSGQISIEEPTLAPLIVKSKEKVDNLNAEFLEGRHVSDIIKEIPIATEKVLGTIKLSDSISSELNAASGQAAASPKAVKDAIQYIMDKKYLDEAGVQKVKVNNASNADDATKLNGIKADKYFYDYQKKTAGKFYSEAVNPTSNNRLNYDGYFYANKVFGAVYNPESVNDYAETRKAIDPLLKPGFVVMDSRTKNNKFDLVESCTEDACYTAYIVSDTYGTLIGPESDETFTAYPIAVAGRVLAYVDHTEDLSIGDVVCSNNHGTLRKMSFDEYQANPLAVIGVVSAIPDYHTWGEVEVDGRVWIKLK